ncbi:MAG: ribosome maturation factor RimM [Candidatus Kapabacteria bacterium]|nr:ribosome maturation factor RimM [Candidatus Kapabacteria bacterium]
MKTSEHVLIGRINKSKGLSGDFTVREVSRELLQFVKNGMALKVGFSASFSKTFTLRYFLEDNPQQFVVSFNEINSAEQANSLAEQGIFMDKSTIEATDKNFMLTNDLIGCSVYDIKAKTLIGKIIEVLELPANNVWIIKTENGDLPFPAADEFIKKIMKRQKRIEVYMPPGIMEILHNYVKME